MANTNQPEQNAPEQNQEPVEKALRDQSKLILWFTIAVSVVVIAILVYVFFIRRPGIEASDRAVSAADITLAQGQDSIALDQYRQVADNYGYDGGNRAALNAAILLYQQAMSTENTDERDAKLKEAISYLDKYDVKEQVIGAAAKSLEGDCYVNLGQYEKALDYFRQAAKISDNNPSYTPLFLMKEATVQRELKNYSAEAQLYQIIIDRYPGYGRQINVDMDKYLERAKAQSASELN